MTVKELFTKYFSDKKESLQLPLAFERDVTTAKKEDYTIKRTMTVVVYHVILSKPNIIFYKWFYDPNETIELDVDLVDDFVEQFGAYKRIRV